MTRSPAQLELRARTWGGRRPGAGRKPSGRRVGVPHQPRPPHHARHPAHVTLRARAALPSLRDPHIFRALSGGFAKGSRQGFRILQFSVQRDHVHLLVEAEDRGLLVRGVQGLVIRLARAVNRALKRGGKVWAERYHARLLGTPREVRHALVYVLQNWRKHLAGVGDGLDPCSSARWFSGWRRLLPRAVGPSPVVPPRTWLAAVGWRRLGLIELHERPARRRRR